MHTEDRGGMVRRRCRCANCGHRYTTYETTEDVAGKYAKIRRSLAGVAELIEEV